MAKIITGAAARRLCKKIKDRQTDERLQCHSDLSDSPLMSNSPPPQKTKKSKRKAETSKLTTDGREDFRASRKHCNMRRPQQSLNWGHQVMEFVEHMFTFSVQVKKKDEAELQQVCFEIDRDAERGKRDAGGGRKTGGRLRFRPRRCLRPWRACYPPSCVFASRAAQGSAGQRRAAG